MNCVSWREAGRYCIANGGELPTPDQWEFAARGHDAPFLWGEYEAPPGPLANLRDQSHRRTFLELADGQGNYAVRHYLPFDDGYPATAPVAVFPHDLGRFGAMDMASISSEREDVIKRALLHGAINGTILVAYTVITYLLYLSYPALPAGNIIMLGVKLFLVLFLVVGNFIGGNLVLKDKVGLS